MDRKGVSKTNLISSVLGEFLVVNRRIGQVGSRFVREGRVEGGNNMANVHEMLDYTLSIRSANVCRGSFIHSFPVDVFIQGAIRIGEIALLKYALWDSPRSIGPNGTRVDRECEQVPLSGSLRKRPRDKNDSCL